MSQRPQVDLGWLLGHLDKRAFGFLLQLLLGLVVIVPGVASIGDLNDDLPERRNAVGSRLAYLLAIRPPEQPLILQLYARRSPNDDGGPCASHRLS